MAEAITLHKNYLSFETDTNRIKTNIKWIYVSGITLSFAISAITINYFAKKQSATTLKNAKTLETKQKKYESQ